MGKEIREGMIVEKRDERQENKQDVIDAPMSSKDRVIFIDKETDAQPLDKNSPVLELLTKEDTTGYEGPIKENGEINWGCPCMAGMISGPCGYEFKQAFSCFHYSTADPKGSDCLEQFVAMRECFDKYPSLYPLPDKDDEEGAEKGGIFDTETAEDDERPVGRDRANPSQ